jgi:hypothetical protein
MRSAVRRLAAALLLLLAIAPTPRAAGSSPDASGETAPDALAEHRAWLALLHQARHRLGRRTRDGLVASGFYLHPDAGRRPDLELAATVAAMNADDPVAAREMRCRFPARHAFLAEHGRVSAGRGPCPELDEWRAIIGEVRLTLVFPEAFLGNPSSMFGHTLLRFDPVDLDTQNAGESLLGWTLDYTADPGDDPGPLYVLLGLVGGYRGRFGIAPYYVKTRVYSDWQDRDIWEYPLRMPREQVDRVLLHVWELRQVELPYVFFTKNCSEYLLDVLEIGWPGLGRGGGFPPAVTPIDTLRAMTAREADAVGPPRLRASPATRLQEALASLPTADADRVEALATGRLAPDAPELAALPPAPRAELLTLAYDLLRHRSVARRHPEDEERERLAALLRARARVGVPPPPATPLRHVDRSPPDVGHGTARVELAGGIQDRDGFIELRLQPAFHEAIDSPRGFAEGGEIRFLDTRLRYYPERERVHLQELRLLDVTTASPWRRPFRPLGWHTELGARTRMLSRDRGRGLEPRSVFRLQGGLGAAAAPARGLHLYGFGELVLEAAPALEGNAAAGPLLRAGASWSTRQGRYTIHAQGVAGALLGRDPSEWLRGELEQRVGLGGDWSLTLTGLFDRAYDVGHFEGRVGLIRYF